MVEKKKKEKATLPPLPPVMDKMKPNAHKEEIEKRIPALAVIRYAIDVSVGAFFLLLMGWYAFQKAAHVPGLTQEIHCLTEKLTVIESSLHLLLDQKGCGLHINRYSSDSGPLQDSPILLKKADINSPQSLLKSQALDKALKKSIASLKADLAELTGEKEEAVPLLDINSPHSIHFGFPELEEVRQDLLKVQAIFKDNDELEKKIKEAMANVKAELEKKKKEEERAAPPTPPHPTVLSSTSYLQNNEPVIPVLRVRENEKKEGIRVVLDDTLTPPEDGHVFAKKLHFTFNGKQKEVSEEFDKVYNLMNIMQAQLSLFEEKSKKYTDEFFKCINGPMSAYRFETTQENTKINGPIRFTGDVIFEQRVDFKKEEDQFKAKLETLNEVTMIHQSQIDVLRMEQERDHPIDPARWGQQLEAHRKTGRMFAAENEQRAEREAERQKGIAKACADVQNTLGHLPPKDGSHLGYEDVMWEEVKREEGKNLRFVHAIHSNEWDRPEGLALPPSQNEAFLWVNANPSPSWSTLYASTAEPKKPAT